MKDMRQLVKQAQKMQQEIAKVQEELAQETVEASAGGGVVKVVARGDLTIDSVTISPDAVDPDDVEMLQDLVAAAVNEALRMAQELANEKMSQKTGSMGLPGLF
ncbi:MAG: YbaB/EbfC family nucleoid-associated protein [Coriobacteriia bacterium]